MLAAATVAPDRAPAWPLTSAWRRTPWRGPTASSRLRRVARGRAVVAGTFVASPSLDNSSAGAIDSVRRSAIDFTEVARRGGLSLPEAVRLVEDSWPRTSG